GRGVGEGGGRRGGGGGRGGRGGARAGGRRGGDIGTVGSAASAGGQQQRGRAQRTDGGQGTHRGKTSQRAHTAPVTPSPHEHTAPARKPPEWPGGAPRGRRLTAQVPSAARRSPGTVVPDRPAGTGRPGAAGPGPGQASSTRRSPPSTCWMRLIASLLTVPSLGAVIAASIFIASMVATVAPADTSSPSATARVT